MGASPRRVEAAINAQYQPFDSILVCMIFLGLQFPGPFLHVPNFGTTGTYRHATVPGPNDVSFVPIIQAEEN